MTDKVDKLAKKVEEVIERLEAYRLENVSLN